MENPSDETQAYSHPPGLLSLNTVIQPQVPTVGTPWTLWDPVSTIWKPLIWRFFWFNSLPVIRLIPKSNGVDDTVYNIMSN